MTDVTSNSHVVYLQQKVALPSFVLTSVRPTKLYSVEFIAIVCLLMNLFYQLWCPRYSEEIRGHLDWVVGGPLSFFSLFFFFAFDRNKLERFGEIFVR